MDFLKVGPELLNQFYVYSNRTGPGYSHRVEILYKVNGWGQRERNQFFLITWPVFFEISLDQNLAPKSKPSLNLRLKEDMFHALKQLVVYLWMTYKLYSEILGLQQWPTLTKQALLLGEPGIFTVYLVVNKNNDNNNSSME